MVVAQESKKMLYIPGFSVQDTSELSEVTVPRLNYLSRAGQIVPTKTANTRRATVLYSWTQVLQLKVLDVVAKQLDAQGVVNFLNEVGLLVEENNLKKLKDFDLVAFEDLLFWVDVNTPYRQLKDEVIKHSMKAYTKSVVTPIGGHFFATFSLKDAVLQIVDKAKNSESIDFEEFKQKVNYDSFKDSLDLE